ALVVLRDHHRCNRPAHLVRDRGLVCGSSRCPQVRDRHHDPAIWRGVPGGTSSDRRRVAHRTLRCSGCRVTDPIPLRMHIDFRVLRAKLNHPLTLGYQRVAAGLASADRIEPDDLVLPDAMIRFGWVDHDKPTLDQIRDDYRTW